MLILLPPSEGKTGPRRGRPVDLATLSFPALTQTRESVLAAVAAVSASPDAPAALGVSPGLLDEIARNLVLRTAPTASAGSVYTGVLYDALLSSTPAPARMPRRGRPKAPQPIAGFTSPSLGRPIWPNRPAGWWLGRSVNSAWTPGALRPWRPDSRRHSISPWPRPRSPGVPGPSPSAHRSDPAALTHRVRVRDPACWRRRCRRGR